MSQDLTGRTFWQYKSKVRYLQRKKDLAVVNNYRKKMKKLSLKITK